MSITKLTVDPSSGTSVKKYFSQSIASEAIASEAIALDSWDHDGLKRSKQDDPDGFVPSVNEFFS